MNVADALETKEFTDAEQIIKQVAYRIDMMSFFIILDWLYSTFSFIGHRFYKPVTYEFTLVR